MRVVGEVKHCGFALNIDNSRDKPPWEEALCIEDSRNPRVCRIQNQSQVEDVELRREG